MEDERLLSLLEGLAEQLGVPVSYADLSTEEFAGQGGGCVVRGGRRVIIEQTLATREKTRLLAEGLAEMDLESVFLLPAVREALALARHRVRGSSEPQAGSASARFGAWRK